MRVATRRSQERPPRKKACKSCTKSKVRCDLKRPACSRCRSLSRPCEYATPSPISNPSQVESSLGHIPGVSCDEGISPSVLGSIQIGPRLGNSASSYGVDDGILRTLHQIPIQTAGSSRKEDELDFTNAELVPSPGAENIRDRWLRPYILPPLGRDEIPKLYHPFTLQYISRVLSTYPHFMLKDGTPPPIIHQLQVTLPNMPRSLANCYSLVRMWIQAVPGSETMVVNTVEKEMDRLSGEASHLCDFELLCYFQAYLIYSIMMYFSAPNDISIVNDKTMITLMEMAFRTARNGLMCASEVCRTRPTWESWIIASAKRRAVFAMYLFSSVYNANRTLPNFIADELTGIFVPEGKRLWEASDRATWTREYDRHLLSWEDGMLEISELWRSPETGSAARRKRIERWLLTADEFGMMLFAVCAHIHGC